MILATTEACIIASAGLHILVDTSVELPDPLERSAVKLRWINPSAMKLSVCESLDCSDHQGGFSSLSA